MSRLRRGQPSASEAADSAFVPPATRHAPRATRLSLLAVLAKPISASAFTQREFRAVGDQHTRMALADRASLSISSENASPALKLASNQTVKLRLRSASAN